MPSGKILIVDDEESVTLTMQAILEMEGYSVTATTKATTALELIQPDAFDVVLTDLRLDDGDGLTILSEVRRRSPDTVGIMLTGYASLESAVKALREGAYDYLFKPCDVEDLRATVGRAMERRQLGSQLKARVSELEAANATIRSLNEDLQRRVDEATSELKERMEELAAAKRKIEILYAESQQHLMKLRDLDELKSRFISMASHELKTPLTAISGFSQIVLRRMERRLELGPGDNGEWEREQRASLEQIELLQRQIDKLVRLVDEMLDVSRIESGKLEFRLAPVDVPQLVQQVAARIQLMTTQHQIDVSTPTSDGLIVMADEDHLEQVLNNLLTNAIKYSPAGGAIAVSARQDGDSVVVSVRDRGVGIPESQLDSVFSLFYQARDSSRQKPSGMGLGLYISKEIVARHGGRIWVESQPGRGSTFHVALPRMEKTDAKAPIAKPEDGELKVPSATS